MAGARISVALNEVRVFDATTPSRLAKPIRQRDRVFDAAFSPDGRRILTGGAEKAARLWDADTGQPLGPPLPHRGLVSAVAFSADGRTAACACGNEVLLWDVAELPDDRTRLAAWVHTNTGLALDEDGRVKSLDATAWQDHRDRLASLGGVPEAEPRWRLDPILFGEEPTARAKAWIERKRWDRAEAAFNEVVLVRPFDTSVLLERADFFGSRSRTDEAAKDYAQLYAMGSRDAKMIDAIVASEPLYQSVVALAGESAGPLFAKHGELMVSQSRWDEAGADFAPSSICCRWTVTGSRGVARGAGAGAVGTGVRAAPGNAPDDGHLWCVRGRYRGLRGDWDRAASDFARGVQSAPPESEEWFEHACLRLIIADSEGYRAFVQQICQREGRTSNPFVAYILARTCGQVADSGIEAGQVVRWVDQAVKDNRTPWYLHALGAAHFRASQLDQAIKSLEESNAAYRARQDDRDSDLQNRLVLAMAQQRLGNAAQSTRLVTRWQESLRSVEAARNDGAVSLNSTDWLPLQILRREAEARILYDPVFPANPFAKRP